jgi:hypothetical protein
LADGGGFLSPDTPSAFENISFQGKGYSGDLQNMGQRLPGIRLLAPDNANRKSQGGVKDFKHIYRVDILAQIRYPTDVAHLVVKRCKSTILTFWGKP